MLTTADLARALNVTPGRVHQLARARGVKPERTIGNAAIWPADATERLRPRAIGYPGHAKRLPKPPPTY